MSKKERCYIIRLAGAKIRFRNLLRKKGERFETMIQMELKVSSKWLPVFRCDRSHNFYHVDLFYKDGRKRKKLLSSKDAVNAIVEVIDLFKRDWKKLFEELHHNEIASYFESHQISIQSGLDNARKYLLNEAKQMDMIRESRGKGEIGFDANAILEKE